MIAKMRTLLSRICFRSSTPLDSDVLSASVVRLSQNVFHRVLVVEDDPINLEIIQAQLSHLGYELEIARTGGAALKMLSDISYNLVLMDVRLPDMDGLEVTRRIRAAEPSGQHIPIIALTAHFSMNQQEACLAVGMDDFLSKPYQTADLEAKLMRWRRLNPIEASAPIKESPTSSNASQRTILVKQMRELIGPEKFQPSILKHFESQQSQFQQMRVACEERDFRKIYEFAHKLRGLPEAVNSATLQSLAETIMKRCKEQTPPTELLPSLEAEIKRIRESVMSGL